MWPKNCWYVAGFAHELGAAGESKLVARRLLDQAVIMWRKGDGSPAALADRCPHRLVPLSTGKLVGEHVECGYHGLRFDGGGACVHVPGQDNLPKGAPVRTFPIAQKHDLLWLWFGAADLADEALIPDLHWMNAPGWNATLGYHHFKADYRLLNDNLLDLSHETYIHKHTVGNDAVADCPVVSNVVDGRLVRAHREMPDIEPPPFFSMAQGHEGRINRWQIAIYIAPGFNMTEVGFHAVGSDRARDSLLMRPLHLLTPESEHSTHYFWALTRNFKLENAALDTKIHAAVTQTFDEDRALLEVQHQRLMAEGHPQIPQMAVKVDIAPVQGRRVLADMIAREQADPRAVVPPVAMADDSVITQPPVQLAAE